MLQNIVGQSWSFNSASGERTWPDIFHVKTVGMMHHNLQPGTSGVSFFTPLPLLLHFLPIRSTFMAWFELMWTRVHDTRAHMYALVHGAMQQPPLPAKPSDVWSCFAWFRSRARGDKPLHLTSPISCSQSRSGGERAREIKTEHVKSERERESERGRGTGTVTYIFCAAPLWRKIQYHTGSSTARTCSSSVWPPDQSQQVWLAHIKMGGNTNLHGVTLQIRSKLSFCCCCGQKRYHRKTSGFATKDYGLHSFIMCMYLSQNHCKLFFCFIPVVQFGLDQTAMTTIIARDLQKLAYFALFFSLASQDRWYFFLISVPFTTAQKSDLQTCACVCVWRKEDWPPEGSKEWIFYFHWFHRQDGNIFCRESVVKFCNIGPWISHWIWHFIQRENSGVTVTEGRRLRTE